MTEVTRGLGPDSLKVRCSNEVGTGILMRVILMCCLCMMAIPPPRRPLRRGLSTYTYPGGVVLFSEKYSDGFCQVSVNQRKSILFSVMYSLRMSSFKLSDRVLNRENLRRD